MSTADNDSYQYSKFILSRYIEALIFLYQIFKECSEWWYTVVLFMQCLVKKDKEDLNDPAMGEFYDELTAAYRDPALEPVQYSRNIGDGHSSPLLRAA